MGAIWSVPLNILRLSAKNEWDIEWNTRRETPYPQAAMLYFASYINTLLTWSRLYARFKEEARCHSFMSLNRESDVSAADWPSQTHVKNYGILSCAEARFLPVVEIRTEHSTLYIRFRPFPLPKLPINTYSPFEHLGPDLGVIRPTKTSVLSSIQYKLGVKNSYGGYFTDLHGHSLKVNIWICSFSVSFWSRIVLFPVL